MLDDGARPALPSNLVSSNTERKATNVYKILCETALGAVTLASVINSEGHAAVWLQTECGPAVATNAPYPTVMACVATTETILRVPAHKRTREVA